MRAPRLKLPPRACDAHCHVFGPQARFPYAPTRTYTPPESSKDVLMALHAALGIERAVLVQPGAHGTDNSALLDALSAAKGRYRGVALLGDDPAPAELTRLDAAGMRGVRFNFLSHLGPLPTRARMRHMAGRIAPFGWHLVIHTDASNLPDVTWLFELGVPVVIDHMARLDASLGLGQPAFRLLLDMLTDANCWVKVSAADRISHTGPPYDDAVPFAQALVAAAPDRVLWGTDFPHPNHTHRPDDVELVDLLLRIAPEEAARAKLLVDNPQRLYRFEEA
jgi:2-pyrone-4,6-dicarboxylate lactonase